MGSNVCKGISTSIFAILSLFLVLPFIWIGTFSAEASNSETFYQPYRDGTGTKSRFVLGGEGYKLSDEIAAKDAIVVLYTHGSRGDAKRDKCRFRDFKHRGDYRRGTSLYPRVYKKIRENDPRIAVFYVCHREIGATFFRPKDGKKKGVKEFEVYRKTPCIRGNGKVGGQVDRGRLSKVCKRTKKINHEIGKILAANPGLTRSRIFISGGSSGGWASLLLSAHYPKAAAGVIAFAPANHGRLFEELEEHLGGKNKVDRFVRKNRCSKDREGLKNLFDYTRDKISGKSYTRHVCQMDFIARKVRSALVFSYETDPFNSPEMLPDFRHRASGISFVKVRENDLEKICDKKLPRHKTYPHSCQQGSGFVERYSGRIHRYILNRL